MSDGFDPTTRPIVQYVHVMEALGVAALITDKSGHVLYKNEAVTQILDQFLPGVDVEAFGRGFRERIAAVEARGEFPTCFLFKREGRRPVGAFCIRMHGLTGSDYLLVALLNFHETMQPSASVLRAAFGLSRAESEVAIRASQGKSAPQIAKELGHSAGTIRIQLKAVFAKTQTRRQSELAAVLAKVSLLCRSGDPLVVRPEDLAMGLFLGQNVFRRDDDAVFPEPDVDETESGEANR